MSTTSSTTAGKSTAGSVGGAGSTSTAGGIVAPTSMYMQPGMTYGNPVASGVVNMMAPNSAAFRGYQMMGGTPMAPQAAAPSQQQLPPPQPLVKSVSGGNKKSKSKSSSAQQQQVYIAPAQGSAPPLAVPHGVVAGTKKPEDIANKLKSLENFPLPNWSSEEIDRRLAESQNFLKEWSDLMDKTGDYLM